MRTGGGSRARASLAVSLFVFCFFFQAEDGIRDTSVTGVQTCALPISTAIVCGWHPSAIMNIGVVPGGTFATASVRFIASAAAVASSSREALAIGRAVRSATIVWKLSSASSRPCAISGWYGVYAVYQPGFSTMLRWMTWGVKEW